ncbi:uroporphyrinogen-III synthase [Candidatus Erwinia haradaeae]|uniref:Uroporphyrinogen-III synthase n=1 Tax=Candidatus Erwinia haradaeae TaxID=1922217 RepID=A0A451DHK0_9GAMM|nr:uroporphyrinogen-III synthase [Candidatus Erwinia haradaeae]VFP86122.1 Uroporphyrinogen-III synthase [Candidatus Erwinia haradaeae]
MNILVTRPTPSANELVGYLRKLGKKAWAFPLIEFFPGSQLRILPTRLQKLGKGDLVLILSRNAIHYAKLILTSEDILWPQMLKYYAIGRSTAIAFHAATGYKIFCPNQQETSETLIQALSTQAIKGKNILILRGNGGRNLLRDTLLSYGAQVELIECYQRCEKFYYGEKEGKRWRQKGVDTIIVTSGEMLMQLHCLFTDTDRKEWLLKCRLIVVSERLKILAKMLGWNDVYVSNGSDNNTLLNFILTYTY